MSLDVYLYGEPHEIEWECCECGQIRTKMMRDCLYGANITHNLGKMANEAGLYNALWRPDEIGITTASQLVPILQNGLQILHESPKRFIAFNPENGWGCYSGFLRFVEKYLEACKEFPEATVEVSR
jgi:hypothetical protein